MGRCSIKATKSSYWGKRGGMRFPTEVQSGQSGPPGRPVTLTCTIPLVLSWYTLRRGKQMLWVMPAPATAVAP